MGFGLGLGLGLGRFKVRVMAVFGMLSGFRVRIGLKLGLVLE